MTIITLESGEKIKLDLEFAVACGAARIMRDLTLNDTKVGDIITFAGNPCIYVVTDRTNEVMAISCLNQDSLIHRTDFTCLCRRFNLKNRQWEDTI